MTTPNDDGTAALEREIEMIDDNRIGIRLSMDDLAPADLLEVLALDAAAFDAELDEWETMTWADDVPIVCSVENENPESCDSCQ
tara:strand:+ start:88 stop:339 length:252 start_codon:yes stop_codon:yes gene_type:complete